MQKLLTTLLLLLLTTPVFAETFFAPQWSDFCPGGYVNIDTTKKYYNGYKRYWASRKINFEKRLEKCNALSQEKQSSCYDELRSIENELTHRYNEQLQLKYMYNVMLNSIK